VERLKEEVGKAQKIFLATDPDREGEAIAYHVAVVCSNEKFLRITFHEITKSAIEKALANPGEINLQLVDAQQARRVLDRLVGYKLSPLLWRKVRKGLSAGRVQSVAVRLIVEREREIEKFTPVEYWEIWAELRRHIGGLKEGVPTFLAKLTKRNGETFKITNESEACGAVEELKKANFEVAGVEKKEVFQNPPPPFTTSTLQQRAAQKLGFSSKRTMRVAQMLYEKGLITYHRTDSVSLAPQAVEVIRQYIDKVYGRQYLPEKPRVYKTKSKVAQEAHEAIRPTDIQLKVQSEKFKVGRDEARLYDLIWKRAVGCQMTSAIWDQTRVDVQAAGEKNIYGLAAEGKVMKFEGWMALDRVKEQESKRAGEQEEQLPELKIGDDLDLIKIDPQQKFTQPPPRFSEATLIKALEERGIGRPSTYAPIVSTIQGRNYVEKVEGKFKPTVLGEVVCDFLVEYFPDIFDYQFTAKMEDELDDIANGKIQWVPVINDFYQPFEKKLTAVAEVAERVAVPTEATGEKCPKCGQGQLVIRMGRFGKFLSCLKFPECDYTAPFIQTVEGVKCPKCGGEVVIKKTKKGKQFYGCGNYPKCNWASWRKPR
jgi:DNA topoisomerase-1